MNKIITQDVELPAHWVSALSNNDRSGLSGEEEAELDAYLSATPYLGGVSERSRRTLHQKVPRTSHRVLDLHIHRQRDANVRRP